MNRCHARHGALPAATPGRRWLAGVVAMAALVSTLVAVEALAAPTAGSLDPTFNPCVAAAAAPCDGLAVTSVATHPEQPSAAANGVAVQPNDDKIVTVGSARMPDSGNQLDFDFALARYHPDGRLDATFGDAGTVTTNVGTRTGSPYDEAADVVVQPDGKIVAVGRATIQSEENGATTAFALVRYLPSGALDTGFGGDGVVVHEIGTRADAKAVALDADGKLVVAGDASRTQDPRPGRPDVDASFAVARFLPSGQLDTDFGVQGVALTEFASLGRQIARGWDVAVQDDGHLVVAGQAGPSPATAFALARYTPQGVLDPTFGGDGRVVTDDFTGTHDDDAEAHSVAVQPDGKIVAAGWTEERGLSDLSRPERFALARYTANGLLDTAFGEPVALDEPEELPDEIELPPDSEPDLRRGTVITPAPEGKSARAADVAILDGKIVAAGWGDLSERGTAAALFRYTEGGDLDLEFGPDGRVATPVLLADGGKSRGGFRSVTVDGQGRLVAAGAAGPSTDWRFLAARYLASESGGIAGTVVNAASNGPVEGAELTVTSEESDAERQTVTDASGAYELSGLSPGTYTVAVAADGYQPASEDTTVASGEVTPLDFALVAESGSGADTGSVAGTVTDAGTDEPIGQATVTVTDDAGATDGTAQTANDGTYQIDELDVGAYTVTADAEGYQSASQEVTVADGETTTVDFALTPSSEHEPAPSEEPAPYGAIGGQITDAGGGQPLAGVEVTVSDDDGQAGAADSDGEGHYQVDQLRAGDYTVAADAAGYEPQATAATVADGEMTTVNFTLHAESDSGSETPDPNDGDADPGGSDGDADPDSSDGETDAGEAEPPAGDDGGDDPQVAGACLPDRVPAAGFTDIAGNTHEHAIECVAWYAIARGTSETTYGPAQQVRRDQMASFLVRLLEAGNVELPPPEEPGFQDIDGNVHAAAIDQLAEAGVVRGTSATTYGPGQTVRRDQLAAFLTRAYELVDGEQLPADGHGFTDVAGNVHETAIAKAATAGFARGTSATTFTPANPTRRDQMAGFLMRVLERAGTDGHIQPPQ